MSSELMIDFPILKNKTGDFLENISYLVDSSHYINDNKLEIKHTLTGQSFIRQLIESKKAIFSVSLYFKDSAERKQFSCDNFEVKEDELIARQSIPIEFSYAPEITPNIIALEDIKNVINKDSGLTDFWGIGEEFNISEYSRIAFCGILDFSSGEVSKLISPIYDKNLPNGAMKVTVITDTGEGDRAVTVECGKGVYDILKAMTLGTKEEPKGAEDSFKLAVITQILCSVYAEIKGKASEDITNSGLLAHLDKLKLETGEDWESGYFNPSLAATKMFPYATNTLHKQDDYD